MLLMLLHMNLYLDPRQQVSDLCAIITVFQPLFELNYSEHRFLLTDTADIHFYSASIFPKFIIIIYSIAVSEGLHYAQDSDFSRLPNYEKNVSKIK
jgi:hypothetical protein